MPDRISLHLETESFAAAGAELARVAQEEIAPAARLVEDAFSGAARAIERDLARAARSGSLSLKGLADSIIRDLKRVAIDTLIRRPLEALFTNILSAPFGGARAAGGLALPGQSYLVGERGPELFTPASAGAIGAVASAPVNVSITLPGVVDAQSFRQSETQIAAALARVIARGARNA
jgi:phage-related minor tail protein